MASGVGPGESPLALMAPKGCIRESSALLLGAEGVNSALSYGRDHFASARSNTETRLQSAVGSTRLASAQLARSLYGAAVPGPVDDCRGADVRWSPARPGARQRVDVACLTGRSLHA